MIDTSHIQDGLHFGLSDDVYHSIPALSSTGIKNLLISGPDFWYRTPWLNPDYVDEDSEARMIGRAYHTRILEGREVFYNGYAQTFDPPTDCLKTVDDLKDALIKLGVEKPKGLKADLIEKLLEMQPSAKIHDELSADYHVLHHGKEFLSHKLISSIEVAAAMIENHPEIGKCFAGGFPEVTVLWTEDGVRFKARFDYLKPKAIVDLKTFGNFMNKPIDSAIYSSMASGKYHIQFSFYLRAVEKAKTLPVFCASGEEPATAWIDSLRAVEQHGFYAVFQAKGIAPLARAKKFNRGSLWSCGEAAIDQAISQFRYYMGKYGELPWIDEHPIDDFLDDQFPAYTTEL